ncbi:hypothetical protein CIB48_g12173, partial [Xylaria polymorpha]
GLPERDPEDVRRELEKLERPERIGGAIRRREQPPQQPQQPPSGKEGR